MRRKRPSESETTQVVDPLKARRNTGRDAGICGVACFHTMIKKLASEYSTVRGGEMLSAKTRDEDLRIVRNL